MQSFIITFYRSDGENRPGRFIGTFADPACGGEQKFTSLEELHRMVDKASAAWERRNRKGNKQEKENP